VTELFTRVVNWPQGLAFSDSNAEQRGVKVKYVVPPALKGRPLQLMNEDWPRLL